MSTLVTLKNSTGKAKDLICLVEFLPIIIPRAVPLNLQTAHDDLPVAGAYSPVKVALRISVWREMPACHITSCLGAQQRMLRECATAGSATRAFQSPSLPSVFESNYAR